MTDFHCGKKVIVIQGHFQGVNSYSLKLKSVIHDFISLPFIHR